MLDSIINGNAQRCHATAKSTKQQCQCLAAYGCSTCCKHGAHRKIISGEDSHFYVHGRETRAARKARPAQLKELKVYEKLLESGEPITQIPIDSDEARLMNRAFAHAKEKSEKRLLKGVSKFLKMNPVS
ncbi:hypothetical protein [Methylobacter psychrophilus]|uniref:hypothetical protein n=1 Tax=Methylobacter psychrophilus TaxID=96941 RepID=UPI0021D48AE2|nr:hypothetical protein [Methylobacter psychrophilus]